MFGSLFESKLDLCHFRSADRLMSRKMLRGDATSSEVPLTPKEMDVLGTLLKRAILAGQHVDAVKSAAQQLIGSPRSSHGMYQDTLKQFLSLFAQIIEEEGEPVLPSGVSDGAKRRVHDSEESDGWETVVKTQPGPLVTGGKAPAAGTRHESGYSSIATTGSGMSSLVEDASIPIPADEKDVFTWGNTICSMPKYEKLRLTYFQLVERGRSDRECADYLKYIKNRFGVKPGESSQPLHDPTAGQDLARFLQRIRWTHVVSMDKKFTREK